MFSNSENETRRRGIKFGGWVSPDNPICSNNVTPSVELSSSASSSRNPICSPASIMIDSSLLSRLDKVYEELDDGFKCPQNSPEIGSAPRAHTPYISRMKLEECIYVRRERDESKTARRLSISPKDFQMFDKYILDEDLKNCDEEVRNICQSPRQLTSKGGFPNAK